MTTIIVLQGKLRLLASMQQKQRENLQNESNKCEHFLRGILPQLSEIICNL